MNTFREAIGKRSLQGISILTLLCVVTFSTYANPLAKRISEKAAELAAKEHSQMTKRRALLLLCCVILLSGFAIMRSYQNASIPETSKHNKVKAEDPNEAYRQSEVDEMVKLAESAGMSKEFIAQFQTPEYRNQILAPEDFGMSPEEFAAYNKKHDLLFEKWLADQNVDLKKGPVYDIEAEQAKIARIIEKNEKFIDDIRKRREKKIEYLESMGLILIFNENGIPIDYEKDAYGNPILRTQDASQTETEYQPIPADTFQSNDEPPVSTPFIELVNKEPAPDESSSDAFAQQQEISESIPRSNDTFSPDAFRDSFSSQFSTWMADIDVEYLDVVFASDLPQSELEKLFPTEESRMALQARRAQMNVDIAEHVQRILADNNPGNRDQKLSIIRQTLSENWRPDIPEGVLERLK